MKVKRYLVDDLPQAVQQIRSELGSDAVILNTKEIRTGGFLGMFRKKRMEVIAAVDESAKPQARPSAKPILRQQPEPDKKQPVAPAAIEPALDRETDRGVTEPAAQPLPASAIRQKYGGAASGGPAANTDSQPPAGRPNGFSREAGEDAGRSLRPEALLESRSTSQASFDEAMSRALASARARVATDRIAYDAELDARSDQPAAGDIPQTQLQTQTQTQAQASQATSPPVATGETAELLAELRAMKDLLRQQSVREPAPQRMPEPVLRLSRLLAQQGVEPAHIEEFAGALTAKLKAREEEEGDAGDAELDRIANEEARELLQAWLAPAKDAGIAPDTRIVHFVGPTGVG
ncbi:hypothetical protein [Cohnella sp. GbtcB17]|uniref:hypothetical protein n=1 Tax=Cohnella sp. GbtcB17 TaxID=2824762 RepID=UPI001C2F3B89|nr:hypothetical protein [Cohnella sp. GbtcB17]